VYARKHNASVVYFATAVRYLLNDEQRNGVSPALRGKRKLTETVLVSNGRVVKQGNQLSLTNRSTLVHADVVLSRASLW